MTKTGKTAPDIARLLPAALAKVAGAAHQELAERWQAALQDQPKPKLALRDFIKTLRQGKQRGVAKALLAELAPHLPRQADASTADPRELKQQATAAEQAGDMDGALLLWQRLRQALPNSTAGYIGALRTLRRAKRLDLAPLLLEEGLARFPNTIDLLVWSAELADKANNYADADKFWQRAAALRPEDPDIALSAVMCHIGPLAGRPKRMAEVMRRLAAHHTQFPDYAPAYTAHVTALRETRELEEADRLSTDWCTRFPNEQKLALVRAAVLEEQKRFGDALAVITALRARQPASAELEMLYARALSCVGRHDDAEAACRQATPHFPADRRLLSEFARIATRRGDWATALERLQAAQAILPNDAQLAKEMQTIRLQLADTAEPPAAAAQADTNNVFSRFESLGGNIAGCEFGIVQRLKGSESVGLMRWTRNEVPALIAALDCDLQGVGDPENTVLESRRIAVDKEEWGTGDKRFIMETHTFVRTADAPYEQMFQQTCRRLRFLRGKMLQDLTEATKIFVFKAFKPLDDETIRQLHEALARHGDNALLCVMRAGKGAKRGQVRDLGRGIYAGYIGFFMKDDTGNPGYDINGWKTVCTEADARWRAAKARIAK